MSITPSERLVCGYFYALVQPLNQLWNQKMATSIMNTEKSTSAIDTEKWETGINITVTNIKEIKAFINWRLSIYKKKG